MTNKTLFPATAGARPGSRARGRLGVPVVAAVVVALLISAGREPRFRELGLVVGG